MATTTETELIPELVDGDQMTADEFERHYHASSHIKKAELIEGVVYVASPVSDNHSIAHSDFVGWIHLYRLGTPFLISSIEGTIRLDDRNQPQPDIHLRIDERHGGQASRTVDHYVEGTPELLAEIAVSSKSIDLNQKLEMYRNKGVREYIVWRVVDQIIDWFILRNGRYERLPVGEDGIIRSEVFPGFWLDPQALIRGDLPAVNRAVQLGLATPEHEDFVWRLQAAGPH